MNLITTDSAAFWSVTLSRQWQIQRLVEWAAMLERRVAELDPDYRAYPWGRTETGTDSGQSNSQSGTVGDMS